MHSNTALKTVVLAAIAIFLSRPLPAQGYPGDCNGDWTVGIGEVQKAINMFLGSEPPSCSVDANGDGTVSIGEIQKVINCFLGDCPPPLVVGLDINGDGIAEITDANGDGVLDNIIGAECVVDEPFAYALIPIYPGPSPVYSASNLPSGMTLQADGRISYQPSCSDAGGQLLPIFYINGRLPGTIARFAVTETHAPTIVGIDTDGDGVADITDADGNGVLDRAISAECLASSPFSYQLISIYAGKVPIYSATGLPAGMTLQLDGKISFQPSCADAGSTISPSFFVNGQTSGIVAPFLVTETHHPVILGLDTNGDGVAEIVDADGDGLLDQRIDVDCDFPVRFQAQFIAQDTGSPAVFSAVDLPQGMSLTPDGALQYIPPCMAVGHTYVPSFTVNGSPPKGTTFKVVRLPRIALDLNSDGTPDYEDLDKDGKFDCELVLPCGDPIPSDFTLVAINAGDSPRLISSDLPAWAVLKPGNRVEVNPLCDGAEESTYYPAFSFESYTGVKSAVASLPMPVYKGIYDFISTKPWFLCTSTPFPQRATQVTAFDKVYHYFNGYEDNKQVIRQEVDFPQQGSWSQVGLYIDVICPESGLCDHWDRLGTIRLILNPDDPQDQWQFVEMSRYITAYRIPMCIYMDVTPMAFLLKGRRMMESQIGTWVGPGSSYGDGWRVTAKFVFFPGPDRSASEIVSLFDYKSIVVGQMDPEHNVASQTPPVSLMIPAEAKKVEARFIVTGHSMSNYLNCAEFCELRQDLYVNGELNSVFNWRPDCETNPTSPQYGTWKYARNGWCPGAAVVEHVIDITSQVQKGKENTFDFDIRRPDGSEYNNTRPQSWLPEEYTTVRIAIYR